MFFMAIVPERIPQGGEKFAPDRPPAAVARTQKLTLSKEAKAMKKQDILTNAFETKTYSFAHSPICGALNVSAMHIVDLRREQMIAESDDYGEVMFEDHKAIAENDISQLGDYPAPCATPHDMSTSIFEELLINLKNSENVEDMIDAVVFAQARLIENGEDEKADALEELEMALRAGSDERTIRAIVARICA